MESSDAHALSWKEELKSCVLRRGALNVSFPRDAAVVEGEADFQRRTFNTILAPLICSSSQAVVIGIENASERSLVGERYMSELMCCRDKVCELNRSPSLLRQYADFFIDRFRILEKLGNSEQIYPPYSELVCVFPDPLTAPLDWVTRVDGVSIWRLGCLKTPARRISTEARQFVGAVNRKRQLAVGIELGHAGVGVTLYIPKVEREAVIDRVLRLDLET